jgi:hypothetical protein
MRTTTFFKALRAKKINELLVISNELRNNFAGPVKSGLGSDVARRPPV